MTVPGWWNDRRYGLFVHASVATVPAFSPIGEYADWYWSHVGRDPLPGVDPHASPLAEVLAYHSDRWSHVERYDDFIPLLSYHHFDADEQVELARDAGMNYLVHVAKHHDGFCWWDAPGTGRTSLQQGPLRDVIAEVAAACRRHGVQFGTSYSLLDWADARFPVRSYVDEVLHPQVLDLVERHGTHILWGDGGCGGSGRHRDDRHPLRGEELLDRAVDLADAQGFELVFNDRWGHPLPSFASVGHDPPADIDRRPWELYRPLGSSFGHNRAERSEHLLTSGGLFDLLTEVIAKGGHLLLGVGPAVDGSISAIQRQPLREVGGWVKDHDDIIHGSRPFDQWGDALIRFVRVGDDVIALDLAAGSEVVLVGLTPDRYQIVSIEADDGGSLHWEQHRGGVRVSRIDRSPVGLAGAYRIRLRPALEAIRLFDESEESPEPLQVLLDSAAPGSVIQLHEGHYQGSITIPGGVTLRGVGWDRTAVIGSGSTVATLDRDARIENIHLVDPMVDRGGSGNVPSRVDAALIRGPNATVVGCRCDGRIVVVGDDAAVLSVIGANIVGTAERTTVERCILKGARWDLGIALTGGSGHRIHRNEVVEHLGSVRLDDVSASVVSENRFEGRWWAVQLRQCDHVEVIANNIQHTMRAVDVSGGSGSIITANRVADGDSGALIQSGATETAVIDNHVERCRIGVLVWDAPTTRVGSNTFVDLHEEESVVYGPDAEID